MTDEKLNAAEGNARENENANERLNAERIAEHAAREGAPQTTLPLDDADFEDEAMTALFASFDEVSTPDSLKNDTLALILGTVGQQDARKQGAQGESSEEPPSAEEGTTLAASQSSPQGAARKFEAHAGKAPRKRKNSRWRAFKVAAVAACLAFALTGGAAYAIPASHVTVEQDGTTVELGVNVFGLTVSATSQDEGGKTIIDSEDLLNRPFAESLERTYDAFDRMNPNGAIDVRVNDGFDGQRKQLEEQSASFVGERRAQRADEMARQQEAQAQPARPAQNAPENGAAQRPAQPNGQEAQQRPDAPGKDQGQNQDQAQPDAPGQQPAEGQQSSQDQQPSSSMDAAGAQEGSPSPDQGGQTSYPETGQPAAQGQQQPNPGGSSPQQNGPARPN